MYRLFQRQTLFALAILVIILLAGILYKFIGDKVEKQEYVALRKSLSANEVLNNYFLFLENRDEHLAKLTLFSKHSNIIFNIDTEYEIVTIKEVPNDEITYKYLNDIEMEEIISFNVVLKKVHTSASYTMRYVLCKENKNSPWLIYAWGIAF